MSGCRCRQVFRLADGTTLRCEDAAVPGARFCAEHLIARSAGPAKAPPRAPGAATPGTPDTAVAS